MWQPTKKNVKEAVFFCLFVIGRTKVLAYSNENINLIFKQILRMGKLKKIPTKYWLC